MTMFERIIRPVELARMLQVKQNNKRPKKIADALAVKVKGFGGDGRYRVYTEKECEVIAYVIRKIDEDGLTFEQAVDKAVDLYYKNTVLVFG